MLHKFRLLRTLKDIIYAFIIISLSSYLRFIFHFSILNIYSVVIFIILLYLNINYLSTKNTSILSICSLIKKKFYQAGIKYSQLVNYISERVPHLFRFWKRTIKFGQKNISENDSVISKSLAELHPQWTNIY